MSEVGAIRADDDQVQLLVVLGGEVGDRGPGGIEDLKAQWSLHPGRMGCHHIPQDEAGCCHRNSANLIGPRRRGGCSRLWCSIVIGMGGLSRGGRRPVGSDTSGDGVRRSENYQQGRGEDAELGWNIHRWIPVIGGGDTHAARERLKSPVGQTLQPLVGYCARW